MMTGKKKKKKKQTKKERIGKQSKGALPAVVEQVYSYQLSFPSPDVRPEVVD